MKDELAHGIKLCSVFRASDYLLENIHFVHEFSCESEVSRDYERRQIPVSDILLVEFNQHKCAAVGFVTDVPVYPFEKDSIAALAHVCK
jgi:hypothetical protein